MHQFDDHFFKYFTLLSSIYTFQNISQHSSGCEYIYFFKLYGVHNWPTDILQFWGNCGHRDSYTKFCLFPTFILFLSTFQWKLFEIMPIISKKKKEHSNSIGASFFLKRVSTITTLLRDNCGHWSGQLWTLRCWQCILWKKVFNHINQFLELSTFWWW